MTRAMMRRCSVMRRPFSWHRASRSILPDMLAFPADAAASVFVTNCIGTPREEDKGGAPAAPPFPAPPGPSFARGYALALRLRPPPRPLVPRPISLDRKSVEWGKGVSVRVDLGGRRIIRKKQKIKS